MDLRRKLMAGKAKFFKPWSLDADPFSLSLPICLPQKNVFLFLNKEKEKAVYTTNSCTLKHSDLIAET